MRKVILHGVLAKKYGRVFNLEVRTAGEAIRALISNFPSFREDITNGSWHVVRGKSIKKGSSLTEYDVSYFNLGKGDLHITPAITGSKRGGGALKIILGVTLIGAAFLFTGGALSQAIGTGVFSSVTGTHVAVFGLALALSGVSTLLSPEEKTHKDKNDNSFIMNGPSNISDQAIPVPLVYGEVITGGGVVSGGTDIERMAV